MKYVFWSIYSVVVTQVFNGYYIQYMLLTVLYFMRISISQLIMACCGWSKIFFLVEKLKI